MGPPVIRKEDLNLPSLKAGFLKCDYSVNIVPLVWCVVFFKRGLGVVTLKVWAIFFMTKVSEGTTGRFSSQTIEQECATEFSPKHRWNQIEHEM